MRRLRLSARPAGVLGLREELRIVEARCRSGVSPMIACNVEDLPAPFGPIRPMISPGATANETPRTAWTPP